MPNSGEVKLVSYWQYWNLKAAPFASNGRNCFFRGQSIDEALARIEFICGQRRNLATLLGSAGVGKSSLLNYLVANPPRQSGSAASRVTIVSMLGLTGGELAIELARRLTGRRMQTAVDAWSALNDLLATASRTESQTLLLIDDVESCGAEAENDLVRLVRAAGDAHTSVILTIEAHLASTVSRWLMERSYLQIELPTWSLDQTREFLRFSLAQSGRSAEIFTDSATTCLHELSRGTVRRLVQIADLALIAGAVARTSRIDDSIVAQVAQELPKPNSMAA